MERLDFVRLMECDINNFKNVCHGNIRFMNYGALNADTEIKYPDIMGIYGQNGSGKTAVVEAMDIFRCLLQGQSLPYELFGQILSDKVDKPTRLSFLCFVKSDDKDYKVRYEVALVNVKHNEETAESHIFISEEKLDFWRRGQTWKQQRSVKYVNPHIDEEDILGVDEVHLVFSHQDEFNEIPFMRNITVLSSVCAEEGWSVFFNKRMRKAMGSIELQELTTASAFKDIIAALTRFSLIDFNVVGVSSLGSINSNIFLPVMVHKSDNNSVGNGIIMIQPDGPSRIREEIFGHLCEGIKAVNTMLTAIVPDLSLSIRKTETVLKDDKKQYVFEVDAIRDGHRFSLRHESEGIKRIISILGYLIACYNEVQTCLVIDELDDGIFEYLLGEIITVMGREAKGQMIFTSHNLRVLEMLNYKNIICSTTNPDNRYIRLQGVGRNNNKRDFYIRALVLGGQTEELYSSDRLNDLGYAFRKAGGTTAGLSAEQLSFKDELTKQLEEIGGA